MNRRLLFIIVSLAVIPSTALRLRAQNPPVSSFAEPEQANSREEDLYNQGYDALANANYDQAIAKFDQVAKMRGRKADAALYWKGYALGKAGNKTEASATFTELRKAYPQSKWIKDADAAEAEWKGATGSVSGALTDEEWPLAFAALMNSDPDKGVEVARTRLQGNSSPKTKDKILFVLATQGGEKGQDVVLSIAKASNDPDLQKRAIRYIGMMGNSRGRAALKEIYDSSNDVSVKKSMFQAWLMCGCKEEVLGVARQEKSPELRKEAIRYLGMMGGRSEMRELYKQTDDTATKLSLLQAMGIGGDVEGMTQIAQTDKDPEIRRHAVKNLGIFGGHAASDTLVSIYNSQTDLDTKREVINALFLSGSAKQMVELARKETNPELRKTLVQKMSLMSSPEITQYMMELLNK